MSKFEQVRRESLIQSLAIDALGMGSYLFPLLGEGFDVVLAPLLSWWILRLHGSAVAATFIFFEEIIPYTDIFPTATITWWVRFILQKEKTRQSLESESSTVDQ